jgi:hypothetical protein
MCPSNTRSWVSFQYWDDALEQSEFWSCFGPSAVESDYPFLFPFLNIFEGFCSGLCQWYWLDKFRFCYFRLAQESRNKWFRIEILLIFFISISMRKKLEWWKTCRWLNSNDFLFALIIKWYSPWNEFNLHASLFA